MLRALLIISVSILLCILTRCSAPADRDIETLRIHQASIRWLDSINWVDRANDTIVSLTYGNGQSGHLVFLLNSFLLTSDSAYLERAKVIGAKLEGYLLQIDTAQVQAYDFIERISASDSIMLLPYGVPDLGWSNPYDIGWAHGPAGVARFCYVMHELTREGRYLEGLRKCYVAIELSGIPNNPDSLFGYDEFPLDYRFGMAGVADFLLDYQRTVEDHDPSVGALADSVCTALIKRASVENGRGFWPFTPYEFMRTNDFIVSYTGHFYGSSGILLPLMKRATMMEGKRFVNYLDNPF